MVEQIRHTLSDFGQFHIKYMGYNIFDNHRKCFVNKYVLWHSHYQLCLKMLHEDHIISRYVLKDRYGWRDGKKL